MMRVSARAVPRAGRARTGGADAAWRRWRASASVGCRASPRRRRRRAQPDARRIAGDDRVRELRSFLDPQPDLLRLGAADAPDRATRWTGPPVSDDELPGARSATTARCSARHARATSPSTRPADAAARRRLRHRDHRRRPGRPGRGRVRRIGRTAHAGHRARGARRSGGHLVAHRELPRLSRPACRATSSRAARCSRRAGSAPRSLVTRSVAGIDPATQGRHARRRRRACALAPSSLPPA